MTAKFLATDRAGEADSLTWTLLEGPGEIAADGSYAWQTSEASFPGSYVVRAQVADDDGGQAESVFRVELKRDEGVSIESGCGCTSSASAAPSLLLGAIALLGFVRTRRR